MQLDRKQVGSSSRKRLQQLNQQQKNLSNIFQISNFYRQQKFDLQGLKQKLQQVRLKKSSSKQRQYQSINYADKNRKTPKLLTRHHLLTRQQQPRNRIGKNSAISQYNNPQIKLPSTKNIKFDFDRNSRYWFQNQKKSSRVKDKQKNITKLQPLHLQTQDSKLIIENSQELTKYQHRIQQLWTLYQLLARIMQGVEQFPFPQQVSIIKYIQDVCSDKFEFIITVLQNSIHWRFHRTILLSRLLQNLAIIYLSDELCLGKKIKNSHLVNFIGFCSSNLIFIIRLFTLTHDLKLQPSNNIIKIIDTIKIFQLESYKAEIKSVKELILRMDHNNQIINILQIRLSQNSSREMQTCISHFLKHIQRNHQPLYQYSHYIFEFLAYHLHQQKLIGIYPYLEIAPTPYLTLKYPQSVIIEPWGVLIYQKNSKIYIRAHTQTFITELSKHCNIIIWSDLMPNQADPLYSLLPYSNNIYYLYRYHCKYERDRYIKIVWRIGCLPENAIIIDRAQQNFDYDRDIGIELPWRGQKKDIRLISLLQIIKPMLNKGITLKKQLAESKVQLLNLKKKKPNLVKKHWKPNDV